MSESAKTLFTDDQVASLNAYQDSGTMRPLTCSGAGHYARLVADTLGCYCPVVGCDYRQTWARPFMADWSWRPEGAGECGVEAVLNACAPADEAAKDTAATRARAWLASAPTLFIDGLQLRFVRRIDDPQFSDVIESLVDDAERLALARQVLIADGYFTAEEVGEDLAPRLAEWLEHHRRPDVEELPDLPCPKCGHAATRMAYCDGRQLRPYSSAIGNHADDVCRTGDEEHHHRNCQRCSYRWRTNDIASARKVCAK